MDAVADGVDQLARGRQGREPDMVLQQIKSVSFGADNQAVERLEIEIVFFVGTFVAVIVFDGVRRIAYGRMG